MTKPDRTPGTWTPRERIVRSTALMIAERGVAATGLRDVVADAAAPWGSLQHYFPDGKEQIVGEAIGWTGGVAARSVERYVAGLREPTPGALFAAMTRAWRDDLLDRDFAAGCPLAAAAVDTAGTNPTLQDRVGTAFEGWQRPLAAALRGMGVPAARARSLAVLMISSLEGALILARAQRDVAPLAAVTRELRPLLDAAVA